MKNLFIEIIFISLIISCQSNSARIKQDTVSEKLVINYNGDADVVQFKMFEGLHQTLTKDTITGIFEGFLEIPNLNEAIFTYDIVVHKKDSLKRMIELEPESHLVKLNQHDAIEERDQFLWIGKNRNGNYFKNEELTGSLVTKSMTSEFLEEEREITVYTPKGVSSKIPYIYFTDGSVVKDYAPYIDRLITTNKIRPIKLIGIHSSSSNRYKEYVKGGDDNEVFRKHQRFVYKELIHSIEKETENWEGKRYLFGFSNGAAFCMHAGLNQPNVFEEIIAFSTADYISSMAQWISPIKFEFDEYPKFYMGAGRYEKSIFNNNIEFLDKLKDNEIQVQFKEFVSGHDYNVWRIEFLEYLENRFKK
ncbi:hypothetical protein JKA74_00045 [Marivirga sp. S37H4]|uniref:Esterase n=1 Tax=Marivirga aurantiaca TaxID=2802615 RepID=A0A934WV13_9BACT|nr:alpha/beta hydrolase-fold protein [Marivirga aurantiaca]MBK6263405.1 hypothetical protein [Marivirga aurantiaca]